jgi:L-asparaginase
LNQLGVVSGRDITTEAAVTKLMLLLGISNDIEKVKVQLATPISGELDLD